MTRCAWNSGAATLAIALLTAIAAPAAFCYPFGPTVLLQPEPVVFLQTPKKITIEYQRDHQVRRVYLNVPHSKNPKPSWYGESVGHYEGDTLVVDTIGFNGKA